MKKKIMIIGIFFSFIFCILKIISVQKDKENIAQKQIVQEQDKILKNAKKNIAQEWGDIKKLIKNFKETKMKYEMEEYYDSVKICQTRLNVNNKLFSFRMSHITKEQTLIYFNNNNVKEKVFPYFKKESFGRKNIWTSIIPYNNGKQRNYCLVFSFNGTYYILE